MTNKTTEFIGLNVGHGKDASANLYQTMMKQKIDIALVQEPYIYHCNGRVRLGWQGEGINSIYIQSFDRPRAAIFHRGRPEKAPKIISDLSDRDIVTAHWSSNGTTAILVSCYCDALQPIEKTLKKLDRIAHAANGRRIIVHGDFNARNRELTQDRITNTRGRCLADWLASSKFVVLNKPRMATYSTANGKNSIIDYTLTLNDSKGAMSWNVSEADSLSDHRIIRFDISSIKNAGTTKIKFNASKADWEKFNEFLVEYPKLDMPENKHQIEELATHEMSALRKACELSMKPAGSKRYSCWWWNEKLERLKKELNMRRKIVERSHTGDAQFAQLAFTLYSKSRKAFRKEIKRSKERSFRKFCDETNSANFWQRMRKFTKERSLPILLEKRDGTVCSSDDEMCRELLDAFFPDAETRHQVDANRIWPNSETNPVTADEMADVINSLQNKKAPGLDGITGEIFKQYYKARQDEFLKLADSCIRVGFFPSIWKVGKVIPVPKGNCERTHKYYRPITLLPVAGKCVEKIFIDRALNQIKNGQMWSNDQFGFTKNKSTTDAAKTLVDTLKENKRNKLTSLVISLDISGAFDNILHDKLVEQLAIGGVDHGLINFAVSYLSNRYVEMEVGGSKRSKKITRGCPQGSKCAPGMFMIVINELLLKLKRCEIKCFAYADDILIVIPGKKSKDIAAKSNAAVEMIQTWGHINGLSFNFKKTQAMLVRATKKDTEWPNIKFNNHEIPESNDINYLGIHIENKLKWRTHIRNVRQKAVAAAGKCFSMIGSDWGLCHKLREKIYKCIVIPICTYACPVWVEALKYDYNQLDMRFVEQFTITKIIRASRGSSHETVMYLSGMATIAEKVEQQCKMYEVRNHQDIRKVTKKSIQEAENDRRKNDFDKLPERTKEILGRHFEVETEEWMKYETCYFLLKTGNLLIKHQINNTKKCILCKCKTQMNAQHLMYNCKALQTQRAIYLQKYELNQKGQLYKIFSNQTAAKNFSQFCKYSCQKLITITKQSIFYF